MPGFVAASAPDSGMGMRAGFVPRGESAPAGPEYERALEEWVLDHIAREMLRMPDGGVPWPVELDALVGYDREVARRVWEDKCVMEMEGQPAAAAAYKRRRRAGRRVRRPSAASSHYSPSAGGGGSGSHYSPAPWDAQDRRGSGSWEDRRGSGSWEEPERRWDDRAPGWSDDRAVAPGWDGRGWEDPMAALERRSGWNAPPYDQPPPPPPPLQPPPPPPPPAPPGREWERRGDVAWMPPAHVTPFDYDERGRSPQSGTKRKRSRSRSSSAASADSQFSYSQPVMSAVHTRVPLAHVVARRSRSRSRSPARRRASAPNTNTENNYRPAERWARSPSPAGHYVPNDPRADHWEPSHDARQDAGPARRGGCFVCGEWGHEANRCPNRARAPHLVLQPGGRLTLPDGRTTVCWVWNSGAPCRARRRKSKGGVATAAPCGHAHACSLCGSVMHPACDCAQFQNRR